MNNLIWTLILISVFTFFLWPPLAGLKIESINTLGPGPSQASRAKGSVFTGTRPDTRPEIMQFQVPIFGGVFHCYSFLLAPFPFLFASHFLACFLVVMSLDISWILRLTILKMLSFLW